VAKRPQALAADLTSTTWGDAPETLLGCGWLDTLPNYAEWQIRSVWGKAQYRRANLRSVTGVVSK